MASLSIGIVKFPRFSFSSYCQMISPVNYIKLSLGAPIKKQETAYGNLTLTSHPPFIHCLSVSDPGFLFSSLILRHLFLSNVISVSLALSLPSSMSRYYISLSLHLSVILSISLDLSIITPLSLFSLCLLLRLVGQL